MKDDLSCVDVFQGAASHANRGPVREEFDSSGMDSRAGDRGGGTGVDNVPDMSGLCTIMTNYLTRIRLKRGDGRLLSTLCWSGYITCMIHRVRAIAAMSHVYVYRNSGTYLLGRYIMIPLRQHHTSSPYHSAIGTTGRKRAM